MRLRYPVLTLLIVLTSLASPLYSGSGWTVVAGLWIACLPGIMAVLDNEGGASEYLLRPLHNTDADEGSTDGGLRDAA